MRTTLRLQTFATGLLLSLVFLTGAGTAHAQSIYEPYFFTHLAGLALHPGDTDSTGDQARFNQPWGLAVDGAGNVYVADTLNHTVRRITPSGAVTLLAGVSGLAGFNDGPAASALFSRPTGVAVNLEGNVVYVADYNNSVIRKISAGAVTTVAGSGGVSGIDDGTGVSARFRNPFGVALDPAGTVLYVTDQNNQTIRAIALPGGAVTTLAGAAGVPGSTDDPANNLDARFNTPRGIAVDGDGNIYVADAGNLTVRKILSTGGVSTIAGSVLTAGFDDGSGSAALFSALSAMSPFGGPCGIAVDGGGNLYVTDQGNHTIRKITPGGSVTTLAGLAQNAGGDDGTGSDARFRFPAGVALDAAGYLYVADAANHTIRVGEDSTDEDCPAEPPMDMSGNLILPDGLDPDLVSYVEINRPLGTLDELYPDWDTSLDTWYPNLDCLQSVGGTVPDEASNPDLTGALAEIGITGVTPEEILESLEEWSIDIAEQALSEIIGFPAAGPAASDYTPPVVPHCPDPEKKYAFGGRDIIFVHGLQLGHVMQKIAGNPAAEQTWVTPSSFPGSTENPEFYDGGYFKTVAEDIWEPHLIKFLLANGYQNRYLIVSYPCGERLEVGAQAILTQISDAMQFGTGVKHVGGLLAPNEPYDTSNFGTPSFVVVSHSTGTILTDVAMTAAAQNPNLNAGFIPQMAKGHVAMDGVFSGSDMATAAIAISGYVTVAPQAWACTLAGEGLKVLDPGIQVPNCNLFGAFASSILVDLVPLVSQFKWGSYVNETPVRTITLVGGHPTMFQPLKYLLMPGFDDGVTTINSQVANPNSRLLWPSGFRPAGTGLIAPYDMGLAGTGNGQQSGLMSPTRANGYYIDQIVEPFRVPPILIAGGAIPYLSPSGMRQDVADDYAGTEFSTLNRYNNHFSYIQSASDHLTGYTGTLGFYGKDYHPTVLIERNLEESRVITDPAVYEFYEMVYPGDNGPLLDPSCMAKVETWERGRYVPPVEFKLFGRKFRWGPWWIWRRVYDLLEGWENKMGCDYMYESVLQCPPLATCLPCDEPFDVNASEDKTVDCDSSWQFDPPTATGSGITITSTGSESDGLCPESITQTWLIADDCGNTVESSQTVTVVDNAPPAVACPTGPIIVTADVNGRFAIPVIRPVADDGCTPGGELVYTQDPPAGTILLDSCQLVIVTVTDACGNFSECEVSVCSEVDPTDPCVAGETWTPHETNRGWLSIGSSVDGSKLVAVAYQGQIYTSTDSGVTWMARETNRNWWAVASSADGSKLVALVDGGQIHTSTDSGVTWTARETNRNWSEVASSADGSKLIAVVGGGQIYTSTDSGVTWTARETNRSWECVASSADGSKLVAGVSAYGQLYTSADSGVTWTARASNRVWKSVASSADGSKLVAVALYDQIFTSIDFGVTWTARENNRSWVSVASSGDGSRLVALDNGGQIYTSTDSGATWTARETNRDWLSVASSADGGKLVAVVSAGQIYTSACAQTPVLTCPTDKTVDCGDDWKFDAPTGVDACSGGSVEVSILSTESSGSCPRQITRTWLITDDCGNISECSQTVTLVDNAPPVIECPPNRIIVALDKNCQLEIPTIQPFASDDCTPRGGLIYTQDPPAGEIVPGPCQIVTVTVWDACDNFSQCEVMVCGIDKTPPTLICPKSVTVTDCTVPDVLALVSASDDCTPEGRLIFTQSPPAGTAIAAGGNQVSVTVTDQEGNTATCIIPLNTSGPTSFLNVMFNTGVDSNKDTLTTGAYEVHYTLDSVPAGTPTGPGFYNAPKAVVMSGSWGWPLPPFTTSCWILPYLPYGGTYTEAGSYTYTKQFVLPSGVDPLMASLSGRWTVVGEGTMFLNGLAAQNQISSVVTPPGTNNWTNFTVNSGFLPFPAINNLLFVVTNGSGYGDYNKFPALRVEFTDAVVNCNTCTPPVVLEKPRPQSLPLNSTAVFHANVSGTPPFSIQWYHNNVPLSNGGHYSGVNTLTLTVTPLAYADAGMYHAVISNPCGEISSPPAQLTIHKGWPWWWSRWDFDLIGKPLTATVGSDLILEGTGGFGLSSGTTIDFGLPNSGGKPVNVMVVPPLPAGTFIRLPFPGAPEDEPVDGYTLIADIYVDDSDGRSSIFELSDHWGTLKFEIVDQAPGPAGPGGRTLSLSGDIDGDPFHLPCSTLLERDAWNRVALVADGTACGNGGSDPDQACGEVAFTLYLNGEPACGTTVAGGAPFSSESVAAIFVRGAQPIIVNSLQFHAKPFTSEMMAGIGGPDSGPIAVTDTSADPTLGQLGLSALSASLSDGIIILVWDDTDIVHLLEETSDLATGLWAPCLLPFNQTEVNGRTTTTAYVDPMTQGRVKFYRLKGIPLR